MSNRSFVGKVEIMGRDEILGWARRSRRQRIQDLKARAAAGDPQAIARLQRLQAALAAPVASTTSSAPYAAPAPYAAATYPQQSYQAPAYQSPYFDPSLSQDPYGPPPQPTVDSFQGDDDLTEIVSSGREEILGSALDKTVRAVKKVAGLPLDVAAWALRHAPVPSKSMFVGHQEILGSSFVGDDERAYAADGGMADKMALQRRITSSGSNRHLAFVRGETRQKATGQCSGDDADASNRQKAKKILQAAADAKTIKRADLRQAIFLYAGADSTVKERTAVGSKMIEFCNKKKIKLEG